MSELDSSSADLPAGRRRRPRPRHFAFAALCIAWLAVLVLLRFADVTDHRYSAAV
jgi:hypothetical protein